MNEQQQQKGSKQESFIAFGFLLAAMAIGLLLGLLKLVGIF